MLAPSHGARLQNLLAGLYNPNSANYRYFLAKGEFARRFAPNRAVRAELARYLRASGLAISSSASPFLLRATGSSAVVSSGDRVTDHGVDHHGQLAGPAVTDGEAAVGPSLTAALSWRSPRVLY